jgi:Tfp pilus assembly protein PilV
VTATRAETRRAAPADAGMSLVEVTMAVLMLGAAVVTIVGAFGTLAISSDRSEKHAAVATTLTGAVEAVLDVNRNPFQNCATTTTYDPTRGLDIPAAITAANVAVTQVRYFDGTTFGTTCLDNTDPLFRLQQVTIRVRSARPLAEQTLTVLKRG